MQNLLVTMKRAARRVIAPLARPLWRRVRPQVMRFRDLLRLSDAWHQQSPVFVNAAASVATLSREQLRMKREYDGAIAELRTAITQLRESSGIRAPARIVATGKVELARASGLKLALSRLPVDGYVTVHPVEFPGVDVVAPPHALPFAQGEVAEIFCPQGLEAFEPEELQQRVLPHWAALLQGGGRFRAIVPDAKSMTQAVVRGELAFEEFRKALLGGPPGAQAHNIFTAESLGSALRGAGFLDIEVVAEGRRKGTVYELEMSASAPSQ